MASLLKRQLGLIPTNIIYGHYIRARAAGLSRCLSTKPAVQSSGALDVDDDAPLDCVVGIETSCDDTGVSVIGWPRGRPHEARVLSDVLASQAAIHAPYAGVVPHFAARAHALNLPRVYGRALELAEVDLARNNCSSGAPRSRRNVLAVGTTSGPGLSMCLRAGWAQGQQAAQQLGAPFLPINHLEGHLLVPRLVYGPSALPFPYLVLLVSGGHTLIALASGVGRYTVLGGTKDDSLGECFDKVARMIGAQDALAVLEAQQQQQQCSISSAHSGGSEYAEAEHEGADQLASPALQSVAKAAREDIDMLADIHLDEKDGGKAYSTPKAAADALEARASALRERLRAPDLSLPGLPPQALKVAFKSAASSSASQPSPSSSSSVEPPSSAIPSSASSSSHSPTRPATPMHLGAALERLARYGNEEAIKLPVPLRAAPGPLTLSFSFSGLKSAINRFVTSMQQSQRAAESESSGPRSPECQKHGQQRGGGDDKSGVPPLPPQLTADIAASFQLTATRHIVEQLARAIAYCDLRTGLAAVGAASGGEAASESARVSDPSPTTSSSSSSFPPVRSVVVAGGVASNAYIRSALAELCAASGKALFVPPPRYCTDNGVMIAWATAERVQAGLQPTLSQPDQWEWDIDPRWKLGSPPPVKRKQ